MVNYARVEAHFCTNAPSPAKQKLKYLFILDHSESNKPGIPDPLNPNDIMNTDASGTRRYGPLVNFVSNLQPDPNNITSFAMINFDDTASQPQGQTGFISDTATFLQIAREEWVGDGTVTTPSPRDKLFTDYQEALQMAYTMIEQDAQNEAATQTLPPISSVYQIIFVSDGVPTNLQTVSGVKQLYTQDFTKDIEPEITKLKNIKYDVVLSQYVGQVTLSTAYYFNDTEQVAASSLLQQMATAGNGQFIKFAAGQNVLYQQFAPPSRNVINHLVDVFIENVNATWWDDGAFRADSDGDGLPDSEELKQGSNLYSRDSDGNGVSDFVEFRTKGRACDAPGCAAAGRDKYAFCAGYSPVTDANGRVTFASSSNDGLNDCEKFVMGGQLGLFSSNGSMIPDLFALKSGLPIIPGSGGSATADPFGDKITNYEKIKLGLPVQVSRRALTNVEPRDISLTVESQPSPQVTCYHLQAGHVATSASDNNLIRIMVVQNGSTIQDKPFLKKAERTLSSDQTVEFVESDFK